MTLKLAQDYHLSEHKEMVDRGWFEKITNDKAIDSISQKLVEFMERSEDIRFEDGVIRVKHEINILNPAQAIELLNFLQFIKTNHPAYRSRVSTLQQYL